MSRPIDMNEELLALTADCSPKRLEEPCVYDRATDELYIVNTAALTYLKRCGRGAPPPRDGEAGEFTGFCLEEGILEHTVAPVERTLHVRQSPLPSLRYLLLHITDRCNLKCRHCFLGEAGRHELSLQQLAAIAGEFEDMQGLRLLISGGEPLLHPHFQEFTGHLAGMDLRTVLLSNGTLIDAKAARGLPVHEVQISIDGMRRSHDYLRGSGAFDRSVAGIRHLREAGVDVSVATMVHAHNLDDFDRLEEFVHELGVREWSIDALSPAGRMAANPGLMVDARTAGELMRRSFGGAIHEPAPGYACGAHLMAVMADGSVAACGFYAHAPVGTVADGLETCWKRLDRMQLGELDCDCGLVEECRGGCRFRASVLGSGGRTVPDLCQCFRHGVIV